MDAAPLIRSDFKDDVWDMAMIIVGKDPSVYRKDPYGNTIRKDQYGMRTEYGWEIDRIVPRRFGGTDDVENLQALNFSTNRTLRNQFIKRSRYSI